MLKGAAVVLFPRLGLIAIQRRSSTEAFETSRLNEPDIGIQPAASAQHGFIRAMAQLGSRACLGCRRSWVQIPPARLLQWQWIDVGVAYCFDSASNKILSPTIPSGIVYASRTDERD
jgi:hypothetical protein